MHSSFGESLIRGQEGMKAGAWSWGALAGYSWTLWGDLTGMLSHPASAFQSPTLDPDCALALWLGGLT